MLTTAVPDMHVHSSIFALVFCDADRWGLVHCNVLWQPHTNHCVTQITFNYTNVQVSQWLKDNAESKHAAVYAVVGKNESVSFVGVSRNVALTVASHVANEGEDKVHSVRVRYTCRCEGPPLISRSADQHCTPARHRYRVCLPLTWWSQM